jgi:hypothetical protein
MPEIIIQPNNSANVSTLIASKACLGVNNLQTTNKHANKEEEMALPSGNDFHLSRQLTIHHNRKRIEPKTELVTETAICLRCG